MEQTPVYIDRGFFNLEIGVRGDGQPAAVAQTQQAIFGEDRYFWIHGG
jgi:hypothetical protein